MRICKRLALLTPLVAEALQRLHQQELERERESLRATLESERKKQEERINNVSILIQQAWIELTSIPAL